jgi:hypothetical protein
MCNVGGTDHFPFRSYQLAFGRRSPRYLFYQVDCAFRCITYFFQGAGPGMMLIISVLCYRATVHASLKTCHQSTEI